MNGVLGEYMRIQNMRRMKRFLFFLVIISLIVVFSSTKETTFDTEAVQREKYLVGAHYYCWYPRNFSQGFLRNVLVPLQKPVMGLYNSNDVSVVEQHIAWCSKYGIDFLALDWWPTRPEQKRVITDAFLKAENLGDIKFCIFYETWALNFDSDYGSITFDEKMTRRFLEDMLQIAKLFFSHPSYLRIGDRPVIFLYLSRAFCGNYSEALKMLRTELGKKGYVPFIIGDEIFWKVTSGGERKGVLPTATTQPQVERIRLFDAITSYNLYENGKKEHSGYGADSSHVQEVCEIYEKYIDTCERKVGFVPNVVPGYNDRGVRSGKNHYVIPRQWRESTPEGSFFSECLDRIALRYVDPDLNMIMITTWNEWNEDTAIEPLCTSPPTSRDKSESGDFFTQGYSYSGYGTTYLEVVRNRVVSVSGRVTDRHRRPLWNITVCGWLKGKVVARDRTDRDGFYTLSRLNMPGGKYKVGIEGGKMRRQVNVKKSKTTTDTDFVF